jgi:2-polyprenyl-3-methyl-5-hydroxy-6-metoxy-1,4-benzoquinol methylase
VMGPVGPSIKRLFSRAAGAVSGRQVCVLAPEARDDARILDARAPYRVDAGRVEIDVHEAHRGTLQATLLGYDGHQPIRELWTGEARAYPGPSRVGLDLATGDVTLNGTAWGRVDPAAVGTRFCWRLRFSNGAGTRERLTSHYKVERGTDDHGEGYYSGDNYVDYEAESAAQRQEILALIDQFGAQGPLLEIGCATGRLLADIDERHAIRGLGVDISAWAIDQAANTLGPDRVWQMDLDREPLPDGVRAAAPFRTIVMFAVLEHLQDPQAVLAALTAVAAPDALLLLETTNCDSLCHRVFGGDWEGYFDRTHLAVDRVGVRTVSGWLTGLGWSIVEQRTKLIWDRSADPTHATLRDWWDHDARFRRLLDERDLGDLLFCAARKPR